MPPADLSAVEASLRLAARRYNERRRAERERDLSALELEGLLRRFDCALPPAVARAIDDPAAPFEPELLAGLKSRCAAELTRLARHARSADPRYDINRHMAMTRLARWLAGTAPWFAPPPPRPERSRHGRRWSRRPVEESGADRRAAAGVRPAPR